MTTARIVDGAAHAFWVMRGSRILEVAACLVRVQGRVAFNTVTMIRNAALADLGLAYLPQDLVDAAIQEGRLVRVLADWCSPLPGYHLYYPSRRRPSPAFTLVVDALRYRSK